MAVRFPFPHAFRSSRRLRPRSRRLRRRGRACRWDSSATSTCRRPHDYPIQGIDVSKYQGNVDWNAVADSGVKFAWIKATEGGDHVDAEVPGQLGGGQGGRHSARRLSFRLLVPLAARRSALVRAERAGRGGCAAARARRRVRFRIEDLPSPSRATADDRRHEGHAGRDGALFRQAPDHLHLGRFLRGDSIRRRFRRLSDVGALDQASSLGALRLATLGVLAISGRRPHSRHRRQGRSQRVLRLASPLGESFWPSSSEGSRSATPQRSFSSTAATAAFAF